MSQQQPVQPQDDVNQGQIPAQPQLQPQPQRQIVPPYNPQTRAEAAQPSTKTFMDYIKEHWWIVVLVFAVLAGLIYWFCFRTPKVPADVAAASAAMIGGAGAAAVSNSGSSSDAGAGAGKTSRSSGSGSSGSSGSGSGSSSTIPKLNITSQRSN